MALRSSHQTPPTQSNTVFKLGSVVTHSVKTSSQIFFWMVLPSADSTNGVRLEKVKKGERD